MHDRLLRMKAKDPYDIEMAVEDVSFVHCLPILSTLSVECWQSVPRDRRQLVMDEMEVVVEEERRKYRPFHNDGPPVGTLRPPVLAERADRNQRDAEIDR